MERPIKENYDFRETNYAYSYRYEKDMIEYCEHLESKLKNLGVIGDVVSFSAADMQKAYSNGSSDYQTHRSQFFNIKDYL